MVVLRVPPAEARDLLALIAEVQRKAGRKRTVELEDIAFYPGGRPFKRMSLLCDPSLEVTFGIADVSGDELCFKVGTEMSGALGQLIEDLESGEWDFSRAFPFVGPADHAYERTITLLYL